MTMNIKNLQKAALLAGLSAITATTLVACGDAAADPYKTPAKESQDQGETVFECNLPGGKQYTAYQQVRDSNEFGPRYPVANIKLANVVERFQDKLACDTAFTGAIDKFIEQRGKFSQQDAENLTRDLNRSESYWKQVFESINGYIVGYDLIYAPDVQYDSLGMIIDASGNVNVQPRLTKFGEQPSLNWALVLKLKDGSKLYLRIECDLQPAIKEFTQVTPLPPVVITPPPASTVPPPPGTSIITTPPPPPPPGGCVEGCIPTPPPPPPPPPVEVCPPGAPLPWPECYPAPKPPELTPFDPSHQGNGGVPNANQGKGDVTIPNPPANTGPRIDPAPPAPVVVPPAQGGPTPEPTPATPPPVESGANGTPGGPGTVVAPDTGNPAVDGNTDGF